MADITITGASVQVPTNMRLAIGVADVLLTSGELVYLDTADNEWKKSDASAAASARVEGIVLRDTAANENVIIGMLSSAITIGSVLGSAGTQYVLSSTAGKMALLSDLGVGDQIVIVGYAESASEFVFSPSYTGQTA